MAHVLRLKKSNCKNCYKCIRHCPVKAIRFSGDQAHIIADECVLCGECFVVCPQDAKEIVDSREKVKVLIESGDPVIASVAPSFVANYKGVGIESMREALKKLGFADAEETAIGATMVTADCERVLKSRTESVMITSCCHSVNLLIQKHYPDLLNRLCDTVSPMQAHCIDIKRRIPNAKTVFIGPCVAKKDEAQEYEGIVDAVLTYEELSEMLDEAGIELEQKRDHNEESRARFYPVAGGILKTLHDDVPKDYTYLAIDGPENCMAALEDIRAGKLTKCFIEMSMCRGSCIGGPVMEKLHTSGPVSDYVAVSSYAGSKDFPVEQPDPVTIHKNFEIMKKDEDIPSEATIREILRQMGKKGPEDELNCGTCGYNSCREKAIAVYQGKAQITMCLPYLKDKAENISNIVLDNTPNGMLVVNERLEIQQINPAACRIMNIKRPSDVLGTQLVSVLEPKPFMDAMRTKKDVFISTYLPDYDRYVDESILYDANYHMMFCLLKDVTDEQRARARKAEIAENTAEVADRVIDKQMRIVQEIASLLGETAAETKTALVKLKDSLNEEDDQDGGMI